MFNGWLLGNAIIVAEDLMFDRSRTTRNHHWEVKAWTGYPSKVWRCGGFVIWVETSS